MNSRFLALAFFLGLIQAAPDIGAGARAAIETVEIRPNRAIYVNGKPFFPIMSWLQSPKNFAAARACGMNATAGYWARSGGATNPREYLDQVEKAGLYGVMPFSESLKGHPALLGYIHGDEPDLPRQVSDATVRPAPHMKINRSTPLWKLLDGVWHSWSVLDPLEGASITLVLDKPVTVESLAVTLTISKGLSVAKEIAFDADGTEILRATVAAKKGRQTFDLTRPATFRNLTMRVLAVEAGANVWGSFGEIEGFDRDGRNALLSPPRTVARSTPEATLRTYRRIKRVDSTRPVFMTFTGHFHPFFKKYDDAQRKMYPEFIRSTDVVGYDIYPIYGWNKPEWIYLVHDATQLLVDMAGARPVYAWIETSKGGRYTGDLAGQKDVTPQHIRAEVWMAICGGATAIGYFTHVWKPSYSQFGVPEENRRALAGINEQITRLTPAILGDTPARAVSIESVNGVKLDAMAKQSGGELIGGDLYMFCVNYDETLKQTDATINVESLAAGVDVVVVDENRTIKSQKGSFTDSFEPLAVHIYRIASPAR